MKALTFSRASAPPPTSVMRFILKVRLASIILDQGVVSQASGIISKSPSFPYELDRDPCCRKLGDFKNSF